MAARTVPATLAKKLTVVCASFLALAAAPGCGDDGGVTSAPIIVTGSGSGPQVSSGKLIIDMPVDASMGLSAFADQSKAKFGMQTAQAGFIVTYSKLSVEISQSSGLLTFPEAFSPGNVNVSLKAGTGTNAPSVIGTVSTPQGGGPIDVSVSADKKSLDPLKDSILGSSLVVEVSGPTAWNNAQTKKLGVKVELQLQAVPAP